MELWRPYSVHWTVFSLILSTKIWKAKLFIDLKMKQVCLRNFGRIFFYQLNRASSPLGCIGIPSILCSIYINSCHWKTRLKGAAQQNEEKGQFKERKRNIFFCPKMTVRCAFVIRRGISRITETTTHRKLLNMKYGSYFWNIWCN